VAGFEELPEGHSLASLGIRGAGSRHTSQNNRKQKRPSRTFSFLELPSSKLIIILENRDYIGMLKEKLTEIKWFYGNLRLGRC